MLDRFIEKLALSFLIVFLPFCLLAHNGPDRKAVVDFCLDLPYLPYGDGFVKPSFNGGDADEFARWVNSKLVYPEIARENGVEGRITLKFTIGTDGMVSKVEVLKVDCGFIHGLGNKVRWNKRRRAQEGNVFEEASEALAKEAVRVVSSSPKWSPGYKDGNPINVTYTFPVIFQLG